MAACRGLVCKEMFLRIEKCSKLTSGTSGAIYSWWNPTSCLWLSIWRF